MLVRLSPTNHPPNNMKISNDIASVLSLISSKILDCLLMPAYIDLVSDVPSSGIVCKYYQAERKLKCIPLQCSR